jgi:hypothetical protein
MRTPTYDDFAPHLNTEFRIRGDEEAIEAVLIEVDKGPPREEGAPPPFSLTFRGPLEPILGQGMYRLSHDKVGDLDLFLVPIIGPDQQGMYYQVIFG